MCCMLRAVGCAVFLQTRLKTDRIWIVSGRTGKKRVEDSRLGEYVTQSVCIVYTVCHVYIVRMPWYTVCMLRDVGCTVFLQKRLKKDRIWIVSGWTGKNKVEDSRSGECVTQSVCVVYTVCHVYIVRMAWYTACILYCGLWVVLPFFKRA